MSSTTNYQLGHDSERLVADYLRKEKFKIISLNWKTKYCEVDIVAKHKKRMYFIEVKSRTTNKQGHGYEYITKTKLKQMKFAAELWVADNNWKHEYQLAVASVDSGIITFIDQVT